MSANERLIAIAGALGLASIAFELLLRIPIWPLMWIAFSFSLFLRKYAGGARYGWSAMFLAILIITFLSLMSFGMNFRYYAEQHATEHGGVFPGP